MSQANNGAKQVEPCTLTVAGISSKPDDFIRQIFNDFHYF